MMRSRQVQNEKVFFHINNVILKWWHKDGQEICHGSKPRCDFGPYFGESSGPNYQWYTIPFHSDKPDLANKTTTRFGKEY